MSLRARSSVVVEGKFRLGAITSMQSDLLPAVLRVLRQRPPALDVRIPKGIKPGQVIRLAGQGSHGDLLLEVEYAAHPQFEVDGRNIIHAMAVAPWEAALGATVSVPTLGGPVELKIPADSEAGRKLRLRGRGLPGSGSTAAGDQIVELEVLAPKAHNDAERDAYRALRDAFGDDWRRG